MCDDPVPAPPPQKARGRGRNVIAVVASLCVGGTDNFFPGNSVTSDVTMEKDDEPPIKKVRGRKAKLADAPPPERLAKRPRDERGTVALSAEPPAHPKKCHSVISLSLNKCLVTKECKPSIDRMVDTATWAVQRTMWFANLVILRILEDGHAPPPLTRDLLYRCFQYSCQQTLRNASSSVVFDHVTNEVFKARLKKLNHVLAEQNKGHAEPLNKHKPISYPKRASNAEKSEVLSSETRKLLVGSAELTHDEHAAATQIGHALMAKTAGDKQAVLKCNAIFDRVRDDGGFNDPSLWRPEGAMPILTQNGQVIAGTFRATGLADQMEQTIIAELLPNIRTYIQQTYRPRRRVFLEDIIGQKFKTKSHCSRVVTHLTKILDGEAPALVVGTPIDWASVRGRIKTAALCKSFEVEIAEAESAGLLAKCIEILGGLATAPATDKNLEVNPELFLQPMHHIQQYRTDVHDRLMQLIGENGGVFPARTSPAELIHDADGEDDTDLLEECAIEYEADPDVYRKPFALLPLRSGQSVFIFVDKTRASSMGLHVAEGDQWSNEMFDFAQSLKGPKRAKIIHTSFRTDGVQIKVAIERKGMPSDLLRLRGFKGISAQMSNSVETEERGVFEVEKTHVSNLAALISRGVIGLDPGVKDVYTSVCSTTNGYSVPRHVSNDQWANMQRTKLIKHKDYKWRRVSGVSSRTPTTNSILTELSLRSLRVSLYADFLHGIVYRMKVAEQLAAYQTRRNRRVYRFSRLLATKSANDRLADAIIAHGPVRRRGSPRVSRIEAAFLSPIVVFGGGQYASGGNGLASVPRKAVIRNISHKTVVCIADEFLTSQKCSVCDNQLIDPDLRPQTLGKRIGIKRKFTNPQKRRLRQCSSEACCVLRGESRDDDVNRTCYHRHWNRDVNAARNILEVGMHWWNHGTRPVALRRQSDHNRVPQPARNVPENMKSVSDMDITSLTLS